MSVKAIVCNQKQSLVRRLACLSDFVPWGLIVANASVPASTGRLNFLQQWAQFHNWFIILFRLTLV